MSDAAGSTTLAHSNAQVLSKHGRSFSWAAPVLPAAAREDAALAYAFCRLVDDLADEAPSIERARADLAQLERERAAAAPARAVVAAFGEMEQRLAIDPRAADHLILGVKSDLDPVRVADDAALILYGYRVAGTVGLMMSGIIGADAPQARRHAVDLGIAMQLTNISRDVAADARLGRVYLPADRLRAAGVDPEDLVKGVERGDYDKAAVARVVRDVVALAERFYASADEGMRFIPPRARLAIWIASRVYRAIGLRVAHVGVAALERRTVVGVAGKLRWTAAAVAAFFGVGRIRSAQPTDVLPGRGLLPA